MQKYFGLAATLFVVMTSAALGQSDDEIIVTGSRIGSYEDDTVPVIHIVRKADFMIAEAAVESDSRDTALRQDEVIKTLEAMVTRAERNSKIELGVLREFSTDNDDIEFVAPFERSMINKNILNYGGRLDTSRATIIVKTPIGANDTFDSAKARIDSFLKGVPVVGRALVQGDDAPGLSIVNIDQYRQPLLALLAADNQAVKSVFGEDYVVSISGLEHPVRWRVTGPLDLTLYFPYKSAVSPR